jgi:hypothetical protein
LARDAHLKFTPSFFRAAALAAVATVRASAAAMRFIITSRRVVAAATAVSSFAAMRSFATDVRSFATAVRSFAAATRRPVSKGTAAAVCVLLEDRMYPILFSGVVQYGDVLRGRSRTDDNARALLALVGSISTVMATSNGTAGSSS